MQTTPGSAIIGQIAPTSNVPVAMGTYWNLVSGTLPFYPTLTTPPIGPIADIAPITLIALPGTANPPFVTHYFAVLITQTPAMIIHSDFTTSVNSVVLTTGHSGGVTATGWAANPNFWYTLYHIPGGAGSNQGVVVAGPSQGVGSFNFTGVFPTTPLITLPSGNNSSAYTTFGLSIGNVVQPSPQVIFTPTAAAIPAEVPEPAALAPGDPDFQFQTGFTTTATYTGGSTSVSASRTTPGTTTSPSSSTPAFPSVTLGAGQVLSVTVNAYYSISGLGNTGSASVTVAFQSSADGGSTWTTIQQYVFSIPPGGASASASPVLTATISTATNLNQVVFRTVVTIVTFGSANASGSGQINGSSVAITASFSFTPYGGIPGYACPIPQILQFDEKSILILGNGYPPQQCDPSLLGGATISALTNTFQASYPTWQASLAWAKGDQIAQTVSGTSYVFTALTDGVSGSSAPTWPATQGATVTDAQVVWRNDGLATASVAPRGAAHGIVYAGSLWLANTSPQTTADQLDGPTCLKMSDSNNPNSWNPVNTAFIGKDDGTQITGLATYTVAEVGIAPTGSLVVFKEFSTFQVIGVFGATDFAITQAQTDLGCIAARSIQFLPGYGIIRLTHMGFAVFNGVKDQLVSEDIRPYLFGGIQLDADITGCDFSFVYMGKGCEVSSVPMYACALPLLGQNSLMTRLFCWDLVLRAWTILDLPWTINTLMQARTGEGIPLLVAGRSDGTGDVERLYAGYANGLPIDPAWDSSSLVPSVTAANTPITFTVRTSHTYSEGSSLHAFYRLVVIRGYATPPVAQTFTVSLEVDGRPFTTQAYWVNPNPTSGQFDTRVDIGITAVNVQMTITGKGVVTIDALDWQVDPKPVPYVQLVAG